MDFQIPIASPFIAARDWPYPRAFRAPPVGARMKLRINGGWWQFTAPMRDRVPFRTGGALYGGPNTPGHLPPAERLPRMFDESARRADYVIVSYSTVIAWHVPEEGWVMPPVRYSVTTSKHQGRIRTALHALESESVSVAS